MQAMDINHHSANGSASNGAGAVHLSADLRAWKGPLVFQIDDDLTQNPVKEYSFDDRLEATVAERRRELLEAALAAGQQHEAAEEHRRIRGEMIQSVFQSDMQLFQAVKLAELARQNEYIRLRKVEERISSPAQLERTEAAKLQLEVKTKRSDYATASRVLEKGLASTGDATTARQRFTRQLLELRKHWRLVRVPGDRDSREMLAVDCSGRPTVRSLATASMHRFDEDLVVIRPCEQGIDYEQTIPRKFYALHLRLETDSGEVLESAKACPVVSPPNGVTSEIVLGLHEYCTRTRHSQLCRRIFDRLMVELRAAEQSDAEFRLAPTGSRVQVHTDESVSAAATSTAMYFSAPQVVQQLPNVVRLRIATNRILCIQRQFDTSAAEEEERAEQAAASTTNSSMLSKLILLLMKWVSQPMKPVSTSPQPVLEEVGDGDRKAAAPMLFHLCWSAQFQLRMREIDSTLHQELLAISSSWGLQVEMRRSSTTTLFPTTSSWSVRIAGAEGSDLLTITLDRWQIEARVALASLPNKPAARQLATQYQLAALCEGVLATALVRQFCKAVADATDGVRLQSYFAAPSNVHSVEIGRDNVSPHLLLTLVFQNGRFQVSLSRFDASRLQPQERLLEIEAAFESVHDAVRSVVAAIYS